MVPASSREQCPLPPYVRSDHYSSSGEFESTSLSPHVYLNTYLCGTPSVTTSEFATRGAGFVGYRNWEMGEAPYRRGVDVDAKNVSVTLPSYVF